MTEPLKPEHANYEFATKTDRITGRRFLTGYAYPANGNVHNPTPKYVWLLLVDGNIADHFELKRHLLGAAKHEGQRYLDGVLTYASLSPAEGAK